MADINFKSLPKEQVRNKSKINGKFTTAERLKSYRQSLRRPFMKERISGKRLKKLPTFSALCEISIPNSIDPIIENRCISKYCTKHHEINKSISRRMLMNYPSKLREIARKMCELSRFCVKILVKENDPIFSIEKNHVDASSKSKSCEANSSCINSITEDVERFNVSTSDEDQSKNENLAKKISVGKKPVNMFWENDESTSNRSEEFVLVTAGPSGFGIVHYLKISNTYSINSLFHIYS